MNVLNLNEIKVESVAGNLNESMRRAVAAAVAENVLPFFALRWPQEADVLAAAISYCWSVAADKVLDLGTNKDWLQKVGDVVPNADIEPYAGPAIPAGETTLSALAVISEPTPLRTAEAILSGYTTYEMDAYIKRPDSAVQGGSKTGSEVRGLLGLAAISDQVQEYLNFVKQLLAEAEVAKPSELRSWARDFAAR